MIYALAHDVFLFSSGFTLEAKGCTPPPPFFPLSCIFKNSFYLYFFENYLNTTEMTRDLGMTKNSSDIFVKATACPWLD